MTPLHAQLRAALEWLLTRTQTDAVREVVATFRDALK